MANPIILYDSRFNDGTPSATDTESGYDVLNIKDLRPYTFWKAANAGTKYITIDCSSVKSVDALGIISHNLKTANASVSVESSNDNFVANITERLASFTPSSDKAFLKLFTSASDRYWRIKIVTALVVPYLGVALLGQRLTFPFSTDTPYRPFPESIKRQSSRGKTGHILGVVNEYYPLKFNSSFSNFERAWVFGDYLTFWKDHGKKGKPFFWAWDLDTFPNDVFFVAVEDDAQFDAELSILQYVDRFSLSMTGISEDV